MRASILALLAACGATTTPRAAVSSNAGTTWHPIPLLPFNAALRPLDTLTGPVITWGSCAQAPTAFANAGQAVDGEGARLIGRGKVPCAPAALSAGVTALSRAGKRLGSCPDQMVEKLDGLVPGS